MNRPLIYGSVCSGIEAASVAWEPLGWRCVFLSEIEPFPRAVLSQHYPTVPLRGDFREIQAGDHDPIDLLVGGTPCQAFSIAGLRRGLADERGNLALEYLRLIDRLRPTWLVWENVPGVLSSSGGRDFGAFLGALGELGYGWAYRVLDAQYFGVPQRRRRVFVVGCAGAEWQRAAAVLFERQSLRRDLASSRKTREDLAKSLTTGVGSRYNAQTETLIPYALSGRGEYRQGIGTLRAHGGDYGGGSETILPVAHTLRGEGFDASEDGTGRGTPLVPVAFNARQDPVVHDGVTNPLDTCGYTQGLADRGSVRRLTPRECERLQGFPDDWTAVPYRGKPALDGPRYKAIGNSMAVPVMAWIGARIQQVCSLKD